MAAPDSLAGLDDVDWGALGTTYGTGETVPDLVRDLVGDDPERRMAGLSGLWSALVHQATVYPASPEAVPFLVAVLADHRVSDGVRAEVALLVAAVASASSFATPAGWFVVRFLRDVEDPEPVVELDEVCRDRLAAVVDRLDPVLAAGPPRVRAAAVAAVAPVATSLSADARGFLGELAGGADPVVAAAAGIVVDLAAGAVPTAADLLARAAVDDDAVDLLEHIPTWPPAVQAIEVVIALCERALAAMDAAD